MKAWTKALSIFLVIVIIGVSLGVWEIRSPKGIQPVEEETYEYIEGRTNPPFLVEYKTIDTRYGSLKLLLAMLSYTQLPGKIQRNYNLGQTEPDASSTFHDRLRIGKVSENITNPLVTGFTLKIVDVKLETQLDFTLRPMVKNETWWNMGDHIEAILFVTMNSEPSLNETMTYEVTYKLYALMPIGYIPLQTLTHKITLITK